MPPDASLDVLAGFRLYSLKNELGFSGPELLGGTSVSDEQTWADPIFGLKGHYSITPQLYLTAWGLLGGGASAEVTWDVMGGAGYSFTDFLLGRARLPGDGCRLREWWISLRHGPAGADRRRSVSVLENRLWRGATSMNYGFGASGRLMARLLPAVIALPLLAACQTGSGSSANANVPQAAIDACLRSADAYQKAAPGTATFEGNAEADVALDNPAAAGTYWRLHVAVAGVALRCTVTAAGSVAEISPFNPV